MKQYERLVERCASKNHATKMQGRRAMRSFVATHGRSLTDKMFNDICDRHAAQSKKAPIPA